MHWVRLSEGRKQNPACAVSILPRENIHDCCYRRIYGARITDLRIALPQLQLIDVTMEFISHKSKPDCLRLLKNQRHVFCAVNHSVRRSEK
jgi:hypothetical protein